MNITKTAEDITRIIIDKAARNYAQSELNKILYLHRFKQLKGEISDDEQRDYEDAQRAHKILGREYADILAKIFSDKLSYDGEIDHEIKREAERQHGDAIKQFSANIDAEIKSSMWYMMGQEYCYD